MKIPTYLTTRTAVAITLGSVIALAPVPASATIIMEEGYYKFEVGPAMTPWGTTDLRFGQPEWSQEQMAMVPGGWLSGFYYGCAPDEADVSCQPDTLLTNNTTQVTGSDSTVRGAATERSSSGMSIGMTLEVTDPTPVGDLVSFSVYSWAADAYEGVAMGDVVQYLNPDAPTGPQSGMGMGGTINVETGEMVLDTAGRLFAVSDPNTLFDLMATQIMTTGTTSANLSDGTPFTFEGEALPTVSPWGSSGGDVGQWGQLEVEGTLVGCSTLDGSWGVHAGQPVCEIWSFELATWQNPLNEPGAAPTIPVPPAVWLFGSGLLGLIGVARRKGKPVSG